MIEREVDQVVDWAEVSAVVTKADGTVIDLGVIASSEPASFRENARRWFNVMSLRLMVVLAMLAAVLVGVPPMLGATLIVNGGHAIVTNRITGAGTEPKFVAWGTGAGTTAATDTTLFTETADEARTTGTSSRVTTTNTNDTYQVVGTITVASNNKTITNVGLFDVVTSSSGNLYFKSDFTGLPLVIGDSITFTIKVKFS